MVAYAPRGGHTFRIQSAAQSSASRAEAGKRCWTQSSAGRIYISNVPVASECRAADGDCSTREQTNSDLRHIWNLLFSAQHQLRCFQVSEKNCTLHLWWAGGGIRLRWRFRLLRPAAAGRRRRREPRDGLSRLCACVRAWTFFCAITICAWTRHTQHTPLLNPQTHTRSTSITKGHTCSVCGDTATTTHKTRRFTHGHTLTHFTMATRTRGGASVGT